MNERLPFVLASHTGSPVGYAEVAALLFRSLLEIGVEVHYCSLAEDYVYEQSSYDLIVNAMRRIEPERHLPWVTLSTAPMMWMNGGDYKIGFTMMEVDRVSERWVRACNSMNEIWVPTPKQAVTFKESGVEKPIFVIPLAIDTTRYMPDFLPSIYHGEHKFRFFCVAWWQLRKRQDILCRAFSQEFGDEKEVGLLFKSMSAQAEGDSIDQIHQWVGHKTDDQIALIEGAFPWWELLMMMRSSHVFILPTAGEGWGCPPVQALAAGLPVIVTDCQGPGEVLRDEDGKPYPGVLLLPCEKKTTMVKHEYYTGANWWETDIGSVRSAMREVYENYDHWKEQALIGSKLVRERYSGQAMAKVVKARLHQIYEEQGF